MNEMKKLLAVGFLLVTFAVNAVAASPASDQKFVTAAARDGLAEVELGQLALKKSSNQQVRDFAGHLIQDLQKADDQLKIIAAADNLTVPTAPGKKHGEPIRKLSALDGAAFDREFAKVMVEDHKEAVSLFQKYGQSGSNAELKAFAQQTLPVLQSHLKQAEQLRSSLHAKK